MTRITVDLINDETSAMESNVWSFIGLLFSVVSSGKCIKQTATAFA